MKVQTDSERVRLSRRLVLELLASSVDLSTTPVAPGYLERYDGAARAVRPAGAARSRPRPQAHRPSRRARRPRRRRPCTRRSRSTTSSTCATTRSASSVTSASTPAASSTRTRFAIHVAGRGFDARISTEYVAELPESACVYCGNCIAVCPTGALMFRSEHELREAGDWREDDQAVTTDRVPVLRRRLQPRAARAGQHDREGDEPRRPRRHARQPVIKGRFGPARRRAAAARRVAQWRLPKAPARASVDTCGQAVQDVQRAAQ